MTTNATPWHILETGDIVDIVAPGYGCDRKKLSAALKLVELLGLVPRIPSDIFGKDAFSSNNDGYRLKHLKMALAAKDSKAVWCLRGGYGTTRLLPGLLLMPKPAQPKLLIGFSDITALHLLLNQHWRWPSLHGPVLAEVATGKNGGQKAVKELSALIFGAKEDIQFPRLAPMNDAARKKGVISAPILGGNLSLLVASLGTSWALSRHRAILFIEEVSERGYRIDRMLTQLLQAGVLADTKAVVFGDMTGGEEKDGKTLVPKAMERLAAELSIPVFKGVKSGHGDMLRPLPLGVQALLETGAQGRLICPAR